LKTIVPKLYEGMFLVDTALAAADWDGVNDFIKGMLEKSGAEIISMKKWDDRKLAYDIQGKSRGTYILVFFKAEGPKVREIERTFNLSERVMRVLILNVDEMGQEYMDKPTPAMIGQEVPVRSPEEPEEGVADEIGEIPSIDVLDEPEQVS
jgi:small subunit ribosomal protein S6